MRKVLQNQVKALKSYYDGFELLLQKTGDKFALPISVEICNPMIEGVTNIKTIWSIVDGIPVYLETHNKILQKKYNDIGRKITIHVSLKVNDWKLYRGTHEASFSMHEQFKNLGIITKGPEDQSDKPLIYPFDIEGLKNSGIYYNIIINNSGYMDLHFKSNRPVDIEFDIILLVKEVIADEKAEQDFHDNREIFYCRKVDHNAFQLVECKTTGLSHHKWMVDICGMSEDTFENTVRGFKDNDGVYFYKGSEFKNDNDVEQAALALGALFLPRKIYCGMKPGEIGEKWQPIKEISLGGF